MSSSKYPNECCRCGYCCLYVTCPIGQVMYGDGRPCPALSFENNTASCELAGIVPVGDGCCIKARAYKDGKEYDFDSLPPSLKMLTAQSLRLKLERAEKCKRQTIT